jgi:hypothetical protein
MAGPQNELDFMVGDDHVDQTLAAEELTAAADTIVIGRKVFHGLAGY